MRRLIALFLVVGFVIGMVGCKPEEAEEAPPEQEESVETDTGE